MSLGSDEERGELQGQVNLGSGEPFPRAVVIRWLLLVATVKGGQTGASAREEKGVSFLCSNCESPTTGTVGPCLVGAPAATILLAECANDTMQEL